MHLHTAYVHTSTIDDSDIHTHIYIRSWHSSWRMKLCLLHISVTYVRIFTYDMHIRHELQTSVTWVHLFTRNTCTYVYCRSQRHMHIYLTTICTYAANYRFQWHKYIYLHTTYEPMFTSYLSDICTHTHIRYVYMPRTTNLHDRSTYLYTQHMHLRLLYISASCTRIFTYNVYICHELQMSDQERYISLVTLYDRVREISLYDRVREILHCMIDFVRFYAVWYSSWRLRQLCDTTRRNSKVYPLQHTATQCNTLQHTASHCNTLQHTTPSNVWHDSPEQQSVPTATHCNTLQHTATHCNTQQHAATHCNTLQHTIHCNTMQHTWICSPWLLVIAICSYNLLPQQIVPSATHYSTMQHNATH